MDRAQSQGEMTPEQAQRAIEQARRQLDSALDQLTGQRQAAAEEAFSDLTERAEALLEAQRRIAAELQQVANESFRNRDDNGARQNPLGYEEAIDMSERKWAMQEYLEALEEDIQRVANQFRPQTPGASEELYDALADLQQTQAALRLGAAAARIRRGLADELAPFEGVTTAALEDLRRDTEQALATASREAREGQQQEQDATSELVAELQALRRELAQFQNGAAGQQAGENAQGGNRASRRAAAGASTTPTGAAWASGTRAGRPFPWTRRRGSGWKPSCGRPEAICSAWGPACGPRTS